MLLSPTSSMRFSTYNLPLPGHVLIYGPPVCSALQLCPFLCFHFLLVLVMEDLLYGTTCRIFFYYNMNWLVCIVVCFCGSELMAIVSCLIFITL